MDDLGPAYTIGLAEWHVTRIGEGRRIALRQTPTRGLAVFERPGEVEWCVYDSPHGERCIHRGAAASLEAGQQAADAWADGRPVAAALRTKAR